MQVAVIAVTPLDMLCLGTQSHGRDCCSIPARTMQDCLQHSSGVPCYARLQAATEPQLHKPAARSKNQGPPSPGHARL